jgi:hypothetical protein
MLLRSLGKMGCKYLIEVADVYRGGVSQSNGGGYNPWGGKKYHIHSLEAAYSIN